MKRTSLRTRAITPTLSARLSTGPELRRWYESLPELIFGPWRELDFGVFRRLRQLADPVEHDLRDEVPRLIAEACDERDAMDSVLGHLQVFFGSGLGQPSHFHPSGPLSEYAFMLPSGRRVVFERVEAAKTPTLSESSDKTSPRYVLAADRPLACCDDELRITFEIQPMIRRTKQSSLDRTTCRTLLAHAELVDWLHELREPLSTANALPRSRLAWHVDRFTHWSQRPLVMHANLVESVGRALDDYLHREFLDLNALDLAGPAQLEARLVLVRLIREIGQRIIVWLDQRERCLTDVWRQSPRVAETHYCLTLDHVPLELLPEVARNPRQLAAWRAQFALDELRPAAEREKPLTVDFLQSQPFLVLDTQFFDAAFCERLLASFADLDEACDGLIVQGENAQALRWLQARYRDRVRCVVIDPPYNTGTDAWTYADRFEGDHWSLMMDERLTLARDLMRDDAAIFIMLDDHELPRLRQIMDRRFGEDNFLATLVWEKVHTRKNSARHFSVSHDYLPVYARDKSRWRRTLLPREETQAYHNPDHDPRGPWKLDPVYANKPYSADYRIHKPNGVVLAPPAGRYWRFSEANFLSKAARGEVIWSQEEAYPMVKRYLADVQDGLVPVTLLTRKFAGDNALAAAELQALFGGGRPVSYPKPSRLVERLLQIATQPAEGDIVLDFFAGSGTTAQAVINQNRADGGHRKYILVEQANYFDSVLKERVLRTVYSRDWQQGRPLSRAGVSHMLRVVRLEPFEQALAMDPPLPIT